ncbi:MAG: hypothetical protein K6F11_08225 [Lachnospiraceae bacterium]|nr:hypothetical protein [Lachnospiraceae bacterium]
MTYEDLRKANQTIKTVKIKDKEYAEVSQRIKAFRMCYPEGSIRTYIISNENGVCVIRAEVMTDQGRVLGTGTAFEEQSANYINKVSYIENCETSAVGRALGMAGFGVDVAVASAEEVMNANQSNTSTKRQNKEKKQQEDAETMKITDVMIEALSKRIVDDNIDRDKLLAMYKVKSIADLNMKYFRNINEHWDKVKASCTKVDNAAEKELFG